MGLAAALPELSEWTLVSMACIILERKTIGSRKLGDEVVEESNGSKNLGIVKNYVGSF